ncbi:NAD-dependent epimerase/dehydratase family protein [Schaalia sp. ZJ405]|uniref:NAD-dependent epimerase/dehydratase family protein n=1 Tax=Schaalia sp. ZJ405 TaxID=2709403 RepID=UPI0013ED121D|nr:NAD-dependent epimerase/dehydratase family protein [Schaalia sp. ZJ405]QPK81643.1 NAD-dependent epimerase/dehydratase family protein [Schaalia sp. ZJ405]
MGTTTYLVTGGAGHLGSTIVRFLARSGSRVRSLVLPHQRSPRFPSVDVVTGDVTNPDSLKPFFSGITGENAVLIHTVGLISIGGVSKRALYHVNVDGTRNVIEAAIRQGIRRIVHVSSVHAIPEPQDPSSIIREVTHFDPDLVVGDYAKSKAVATQMVLDHVGKGTEILVVHPSGILGPYDRGGNHLVHMIDLRRRGHLPFAVRGGYDFVDVRDVAQGCINATTMGRDGGTYLLSGHYAQVSEVLEMVDRSRVPAMPRVLATACAPIAEGVARVLNTQPLFTRYAIHTLGTNGRFTHDAATRELGFIPRPLRQSVEDTVAYLGGERRGLLESVEWRRLLPRPATSR